jgi:zinc transport system permease protein
MLLTASHTGLSFIDRLSNALGYDYTFEFRALLSVLLVTAICGMVGALVVGNRMAFFSDAMAHCAFAGVALGVLLTLALGSGKQPDAYRWLIPLVMVAFGALVGLAIALVKEKTDLASDTVIGVFFAGAIGFGAMLLTALKQRRAIDPDNFLFGSPLYVQDIDFLYLAVLFVLVIALLFWRYNHLLLASFNSSLARSRRISLRLNNYLFILLLALIVNFSIVTVGALLINAMLIVPAATASNIARNLRQMFWLTLAFSMAAGQAGLYLSEKSSSIPFPSGIKVEFGPSGTIICVSVLLFFLSILMPGARRRLLKNRSQAV